MAKKQIPDIYVDYFQKSKVFLLPALNIKRGTSVTPIETYLSWGDEISVNDNKLICLYHLRDDEEFISYEERFLLGNPLFDDYKEVGEGKAAYIFDFTEYKEDFQHIVNATYSQISQELKTKIRDIYGAGSSNYNFIKTYLYPEKYYERYAELLCPTVGDRPEMVDLLKEVGELCSKPDFKKEKLKMSVKSLKL